MSAQKKDPNQQKVAALRELGHHEAADDLEALYAGEAEVAAEREKQRDRPGIPLMDIGPAELQRQHEGQILLGELQRFRGDRPWSGSIPLLSNDNGNEGRR